MPNRVRQASVATGGNSVAASLGHVRAKGSAARMELPPVATTVDSVETDGNSREDLRAVIHELHLSDKAAAIAMGCSTTDLSKALNGFRCVDNDWLRRDPAIWAAMRARTEARMGLAPEAEDELILDRLGNFVADVGKLIGRRRRQREAKSA